MKTELRFSPSDTSLYESLGYDFSAGIPIVAKNNHLVIFQSLIDKSYNLYYCNPEDGIHELWQSFLLKEDAVNSLIMEGSK